MEFTEPSPEAALPRVLRSPAAFSCHPQAFRRRDPSAFQGHGRFCFRWRGSVTPAPWGGPSAWWPALLACGGDRRRLSALQESSMRSARADPDGALHLQTPSFTAARGGGPCHRDTVLVGQRGSWLVFLAELAEKAKEPWV